MSLSVRQLLAAGRARVLEKEPYLAHAVMSLVPREKPGMCEGRGWGVRSTVAPFAVTEGWIMYFDPDVLEHWRQTESNMETVAEWIAFCIAHEVGHPLRDHGERCRAGAYHPRKFNRAADFEINDDLKAAGYTPPPGYGIFPDEDSFIPEDQRKTGMTAEEYYHIDTWQPGDDEGGMCAGGSGAGDPLDDEDQDAADARSSSQGSNIKKQTAKAIKDHAERARGEVPGGWQRWAEGELLPPVIPWESKLRTSVHNAVEFVRGMIERTTSRPYRRQAVFGYGHDSPIMPGWHAPRPMVVVVIDTSGSMGSGELTRAVAETNGILESMDADIILMTNDADIHGPVQKISSIDELELHGGGGTDFRPPFEYIGDKMDPQPGVCVFITDGMGPAHLENPLPQMQTIWVGVGPYRQKPWGAAPDSDGWNPGGPIQWGEYIPVDDNPRHDGDEDGGMYGSGDDEDEDEED